MNTSSTCILKVPIYLSGPKLIAVITYTSVVIGGAMIHFLCPCKLHMAYWLGLALISHFKSFNFRNTSFVTIQYYQRSHDSPFDWNSYELSFCVSPSIIVTSGIYTSEVDSSPVHKWRIEIDSMKTLICFMLHIKSKVSRIRFSCWINQVGRLNLGNKRITYPGGILKRFVDVSVLFHNRPPFLNIEYLILKRYSVSWVSA